MNLPVGRITAQSYRAVLGHPGALARCALMPAVVMLAANALICVAEGSLAGGPQRTPLATLALEWGPGTSFTVAWLRWILIGERRPILASPRWGGRELATLALSIVLPLVGTAPVAVPLALGVALGPGPAANVAVTALIVAAALWMLVLTLRTMLAFAYVARDAGIAAPLRSWRATRGLAAALLGLLLLTAGPPTALQALAPVVLDDAPGVMAWLALALDTALYFPATAIGLTASALVARHLDPSLEGVGTSVPGPAPSPEVQP